MELCQAKEKPAATVVGIDRNFPAATAVGIDRNFPAARGRLSCGDGALAHEMQVEVMLKKYAETWFAWP